MKEEAGILQGTLAPMVLKTLDVLGPLHGYGIARFYRLTRAGQKQLQVETHGWRQTVGIMERFFAAKAADLNN